MHALFRLKYLPLKTALGASFVPVGTLCKITIKRCTTFCNMDSVAVTGSGLSSKALGEAGGHTRPTNVSKISDETGKEDDNKTSKEVSKCCDVKDRIAKAIKCIKKRRTTVSKCKLVKFRNV